MKKAPFAYVRPDVTSWTNVRQPIPGYHPVQAAMNVAWQFTAAPQFGIEITSAAPATTAVVSPPTSPPVNGLGYAPLPYYYGFSAGKPRLVDRVRGWFLKRRIQRAAALVATTAATPVATSPSTPPQAAAPFQPGTLRNVHGYAWGRPPMQPVMTAAMNIVGKTTAAAMHPPTSTPIITAEQHGAYAVPVGQQWTAGLPAIVEEAADQRGWRQFVNPMRESAANMPQAPSPPPLPDEGEEH